MQEQVESCHTKTEKAEPSIPVSPCDQADAEMSTLEESEDIKSLRSFRDLCSRVVSACDGLIDVQSGEHLKSGRQDDSYRLLERLSASETSYTTELMYLQRVSPTLPSLGDAHQTFSSSVSLFTPS